MLATFENNIRNIYGDQGKSWLDALPQNILRLADKYNVTNLHPVSNMRFNYIASGFQGKQPIILKLGCDHLALAREAACLKAFAKHAVPAVLACEDGMLLMQHAIPGNALTPYFPNQDQAAVQILCDCIHRLHAAPIPEQHIFHRLNKILETLNTDIEIPPHSLNKARELRDQLLAAAEKTVLLHGDLHHDNILSHADHYWTIDPKGYVGDPIFETAAFICNPIPDLLAHTDPMQIIHQRIQLIANSLGYAPPKIRDWLYVKSVLCWTWCLQDNCDASYFHRLVHLLEHDPLFT